MRELQRVLVSQCSNALNGGVGRVVSRGTVQPRWIDCIESEWPGWISCDWLSRHMIG
jgi:hypothetical protein